MAPRPPAIPLLLPLLLLLLPVAPAQARLLYESEVVALHSLPAEPGAANQHPVDINVDRLEVLLGRLQVRSEATGRDPQPIFADSDALAAAKELHTALRHLDRDQELLLIGYRKTGGLLASKRYATSARVFVAQGRLNLILGQVDRFQSEFRDRRAELPPAGSRSAARALEGLVVDDPLVTRISGRPDWLVLDPGAAPVAESQRRLGYPTAERAADPSPAAPRPVAAEPAPTATPAAAAPTAGSDRLEQLEREFELLERLRDKGLIDPQEYATKKRELLERL